MTKHGAPYLPNNGGTLARVNYPLKPDKIESWAKNGPLNVTIWSVTLLGQNYALVVNGDHRLAAAIKSDKRPHYRKPAPEFRAAFWALSDEEKLAIIRTWGGGSTEWINVETGERIDALSAPLAVPS